MSPQFSRTAVEGSASEVVDSLPPAEEFTEPVCNQVHRERFAAGETAENLVDIPVVHEQVIVQAIPVVVGSLPPAEKFTGPVFNQVHQEQLSTSEMTEKSAEFPVVHEQVIVQDIPEVFVPLPPAQEFSAPVYGQVHQVFVGMRPERLVDTRGPERCVRSAPSVGAPVLVVQSLRGFDGVDDTTAKFLLQLALQMKEKEEEERVMREMEQLKRQEDQEEARLTRLQAERDALLVLGLEALSSQQKKRLNAVLDEREAILDRRERRRVVAKRKRKKRRKKKTPKTSSSRGRARRRQRQCHTLLAGDRGVVLLHAVFPKIVERPEMPCIMAGMVQKDRCRGLYIAGIAGDYASRTVFVSLVGPRCSTQWLVLLAVMLLALCSFSLSSGPRFLGIMAGLTRGVQKFWFLWKMTLYVSAFITPRFDSGYMLGVSLQRSGPELQKLRILRSCSSSLVIDIFLVPQRQFLMVQDMQQTTEIPQSLFDGRCPRYAGLQSLRCCRGEDLRGLAVAARTLSTTSYLAVTCVVFASIVQDSGLFCF